jgi:hypothetical protein
LVVVRAASGPSAGFSGPVAAPEGGVAGAGVPWVAARVASGPGAGFSGPVVVPEVGVPGAGVPGGGLPLVGALPLAGGLPFSAYGVEGSGAGAGAGCWAFGVGAPGRSGGGGVMVSSASDATDDPEKAGVPGCVSAVWKTTAGRPTVGL